MPDEVPVDSERSEESLAATSKVTSKKSVIGNEAKRNEESFLFVHCDDHDLADA